MKDRKRLFLSKIVFSVAVLAFGLSLPHTASAQLGGAQAAIGALTSQAMGITTLPFGLDGMFIPGTEPAPVTDTAISRNGQITVTNTGNTTRGVEEGNNINGSGHPATGTMTASDSAAQAPARKYASDDLPRSRQLQDMSVLIAQRNKGANDGGGGGSASIQGAPGYSHAAYILTAGGGGGSTNKQQTVARSMQEAAQTNSAIPKVAHNVVREMIKSFSKSEKSENGTAIEIAKMCADQNTCKALNICDLCNSGGGASENNKAPDKFTPAAYTLAATGGGGDDDDITSAGIDTGLLTGMNVPLKGGNPKFEAAMANIKVGCGFMESYELGDKAKTPQGMTHNMKVLEQVKHCGEVTNNLLGKIMKSTSLPDNCDSHQYIDKLRQEAGYKANSEKCLSTKQLHEGNIALNRARSKNQQVEQGGGNAYTKNEDDTKSANTAIVSLEAIMPSGVGGTSDATSSSVGVVSMIEDPRFYAILADPKFPALVAEMRQKLPEIYAQENIMIAEVIKQEIGNSGHMYANDNNGPATMQPAIATPEPGDPYIVPPSPHERSASLGDLFKAANINIDLAMPARPRVIQVKDEVPAGEQPMKATLISTEPVSQR